MIKPILSIMLLAACLSGCVHTSGPSEETSDEMVSFVQREIAIQRAVKTLLAGSDSEVSPKYVWDAVIILEKVLLADVEDKKKETEEQDFIVFSWVLGKICDDLREIIESPDNEESRWLINKVLRRLWQLHNAFTDEGSFRSAE